MARKQQYPETENFMRRKDFRVSIIVTSYNANDFLIGAIESVISQTLRPHEIIIADDCSTDGSIETIRSYEKAYPGWIRGVFQPQNVGIPLNRNAALRAVKGNYVGILDGDDSFVPHKLEQQFMSLAASPDAKVVFSNYRCVETDGTELNLRYVDEQPQGEILASVAALNYGILRTMVADYTAVRDAGFMDERYPKLDGLWLTVKLASTCRFCYVHEPLVYKKEYPGSDSRKNTVLERLHDHVGIHSDMQPLLAKLDGDTVQGINILWHNRMVSLIRALQGDEFDAARALFKSYCWNSGRTAESCLLLALISVRMGRTADAEAAYHNALKLNQSSPFTQYQAGRIAILCGNYQDAVTALEQAIRKAPGLVDAHYQIGNARFSLGETDEAYRHYELALELQPDHEGALRMRDGIRKMR